MSRDKMRINQYLAACGLGSRRHVEKLILQGVVKINNKQASLVERIDPETDEVTVKGIKTKLKSKVLFAFYKPKGVVSSLVSQNQEKNLKQYFPKNQPELFPVGRLDKNSSGLMLLTNDGDLALKLTHPRYFHEKEYEVKVQGPSPSSRLTLLSRLSHLDRVKLAPFKITNVHIQGTESKFNLTLTQGLNHQIRRMCDKVGLTAKEIKRVKIDKYHLGNLKEGKLKKLEYLPK